jgi:hypothetical protein
MTGDEERSPTRFVLDVLPFDLVAEHPLAARCWQRAGGSHIDTPGSLGCARSR